MVSRPTWLVCMTLVATADIGARPATGPDGMGCRAPEHPWRMAPFVLPVPVALARQVESLPPAGSRPVVYEPKWDGYRALTAGGRLFSRNGTDLTRLFPDLAPVLASRMPRTLVADGELVVWNLQTGRLDFDALQARMTAGHRIRSVASQWPAQFVAFHALAADGIDLHGRPLRYRRAVLEQAMLGLGSPLVLCQQTADPAIAREWLRTLTAGGLEGVVVKDARDPYPTRPGQRVWWKVKAKTTVDMLAVGYTGSVEAPVTLALAFPDSVDTKGRPLIAGATTVLAKKMAKAVAPLLRPTGETVIRSFVWGSAEPSTVMLVEPLVVEVKADTSAQLGELRHSARLQRIRPDLDPREVEGPSGG